MSCPGNGSQGTTTAPWVFHNWSRTRSFTVPVAFRPSSVTELVAAVQVAERDPRGVAKAVGSGWSYPDVAIAPEVTVAIETDALNRVLSGTDPASSATLIPFALHDNVRASTRKFVHVEAGIKIQVLNCKLDGMGLALETLGGSNGQSLAGAISTGTHGSDFNLRPLADLVRAIHLVGPGGQEWWLERAETRAITDRGRMLQAVSAGRLCHDIRILYDDMLFNAVLVSLGRMGVVYSYVVEVVPAFLLQQEKRQSLSWAEASTIIRQRRDQRDAFTIPRFMDCIVDPYKRAAVITLRSPTTTAPESEEGGPDEFRFVCNIQAMNAVLLNILALVPPMIAAATAAAIATVSPALLLIPGAFEIASTAAVSAATAGLLLFQAAVVEAITARGDDLAQKLSSIVNRVVPLGQKHVVAQLVEVLISVERDPNQPVVVGKSFRMLTGQKACPAFEAPAECLRQIDGFEFALDLSPGSEKLFRFMDAVFALNDEFLAADMPQAYAISLRFVKETEALIGMQQFSHTCHAEFFFLRGLRGAEEYYRRLYALAKLHDAIPHWGLKHEVDAQEIERLYGRRLRDWRIALRQLIDAGGGKDGTFSTSFSMARGLEPAADAPGISSDITSDISYLLPLLLEPAAPQASPNASDVSYLVPLLLHG